MNNKFDKSDIRALPPHTLHSLVVENSGDYAIIISDLDGRIIGWNPAAEKVLDWPIDEAIGQHISMFFIPEERSSGKPLQELREAAEHGVAESQRWHVTRGGKRLWIVGQLTRLALDGAHVGYAMIMRDRTVARRTEERLRIAQQAGGVGTFELDIDSGMITPSEQFCRLWHVPEKTELNISELQTLIHPDDRLRVIDSYKDLTTGAFDYLEHRIVQPATRAVHWIARRGELMLDPDTGAKRYIGVSYDISEQKKTEEKLYIANARLRGSEARFREFAELAPALVWFSDTDGTITYLNKQWFKYTGMTPAEPLTEEWTNAMHPDDRGLFMKAWSDARSNSTMLEIECRLRRRDGSYCWHLTRAQPQHDGGDIILAWIGIATNIHERKTAEIAIRESERRTSFLLNLGDRLRELNEPRNVLTTASELLARHLQVNRAGYAGVNGSQQLRFGVGWSDGTVPSLTTSLPFRAIGVENVAYLHSGEALVFDDMSTDPRTSTSEALAVQHTLEIRALIIVPQIMDGRLRAVHFVSHRLPRPWSKDEVKLVEEVAKRTWTALETMRVARALERTAETAIAERDRLWQSSPDLLSVINSAGQAKSVNPAVTNILGWSPEEFTQAPLVQLIHPEDVEKTRVEINRLLHDGALTSNFENRVRHKNGSYRSLSWTAVAFEGTIYASARDVSDIKQQAAALQQAEEALRQAQKMEVVGRLTGGIAHDFNNLLQGITAPLELMQRYLQMGRTNDLGRFLTTAMGSASRAAALTHRLLAFSRRKSLVPRRIDVNQLISSMAELLRRTMGESIQVTFTPFPAVSVIRCDENQLENAILNLAINARDAMPEGGRLTIETTNVNLDPHNTARPAELLPGEYVVISVSDTGIGMPEEVISKAFDPFYTTKPIGQGTGLGLSMTYSFTKQTGGIATIYSEPNRGTTVKLYLPRDFGEAEKKRTPAEPKLIRHNGSNETILLVEDDLVVRQMIEEVLQEINYRVLSAGESSAALDILQSDASIDLLVTDLGLPGMNGRELADKARQVRPGMRILFMTGYAESAARESGFLEPGMEMITKPFTLETFTDRVRQVIGTNGVA